MKKALWILGALALVGFGMTGCGEDGEPCGDTGLVCGSDLSVLLKPFCVEIGAKDGKGQMTCSAYQSCTEYLEDHGEDLVFDKNGLCVNAVQDDYCEVKSECGDGEVCNKDTHRCEPESTVTEDKFSFVRIDDASTNDLTWNGTCFESKGSCVDDPGADIDAVVLKKADGALKYAKEIYDYSFAGGKITYKKGDEVPPTKLATNPLNIKGAPDSIENYGDDSVTCKLYNDDASTNCFFNNDVQCEVRPFVSLGGPGGYIIVEMEADIEAGDTLDILEVGDCKMINCNDKNGTKTDCGTAVKDGVKVYVSINDSTKENWKIVGDTGKQPDKGVISFPISADILSSDDVTL